MGIDNVYGTGSLRPGVCTSTSRPGSPFEGQVIYETDTNRVLVWDNSAWVMIADTDSPPGLQLIKTQTIGTAVSSVTVTDAFSADFDNYQLIVNGGVASGNIGLNLTFGSTATGYYFARLGYQYNGVASNGNGANTTSFTLAGFGTASALILNLHVQNPFLSKVTTVTGQWVDVSTGGSLQNYGGILDNTTSYTAFTLTTASGTITGGTVRVYGYRNS